MSTWYVDAMSGRDRNSGRSPAKAWKTLRRARRQALGAGDALLLRRGSSWPEPLALRGSGRPGRPITVAAYGAGPRPRLAPRGVTVVTNEGPVSWWRLARLELCGAEPWAPYAREGGRTAGIAIHQTVLSEGLLIEDCVVHDVSGPGIAFHAGDSAGTVFRGWTVAGCEVYHASTGITAGGPWPPGGDPWKFHEKFAVRDCRVHDIGTDGIVLSHCRDGVIERCTAWRTGIGRTRRTPVGIWFFQALRCVIRLCESFDNHTAGGKADGGGFDLDGGAVDCSMLGNYSHDNDGAGYLVCSYDPVNAPCTGCSTLGNVSVNDGRANDYGAILFWQAHHCRTERNLCVTRISPGLKFTSETHGNVFADNVFVVDTRSDVAVLKSTFPVDGNTFRGNRWWRTGGRPRFELPGHRRLDLRGYARLTGATGERVTNPGWEDRLGRELRRLGAARRASL
jgi:hypothetical protein